ncbi:uncharacterized protein MELLADRAFT_59028 [Melampsora larici-populina 98AG31]|uniref:Uncharacterized protein n=1 Tax=Melampsora larici-populina (strain 98AG31 / pathotype 3-4-7) TaxID=747676 RepID=F4R6T2_MELLP|nr:uncharacterized protein MELLADRAFT_59028 [Melampsora larici-populina 98AG31]EGG12403.1 hypothetical protein MELLADRAFT_59028 [Melampsora larici-populina 98AG31]
MDLRLKSLQNMHEVAISEVLSEGSQAAMLQHRVSKFEIFEELATASTTSSQYIPQKYLEDVDTTLSLYPGSAGKRYPEAKRFLGRKNGQNSWLKLYEGDSREPHSFEFFPLYPEKSLRGNYNIDIHNSPGTIKLGKHINHQEDQFAIGAKEDLVLSLGITPQSKELQGFKRPLPPNDGHSNYLPVDKIHFKLGLNQELESEKEANRYKVHIQKNNSGLKKPKLEAIAVENDPMVISQWDSYTGIDSHCDGNNKVNLTTSHSPPNDVKLHGSEVEHFDGKSFELRYVIPLNYSLIVGTFHTGMNLSNPFGTRKLIIPGITWNFKHFQLMQPELPESYRFLKEVSGLHRYSIRALSNYPELVSNLQSLIKQQPTSSTGTPAIRNMVVLFVGLWMRQSKVAEIYGIQHRTHDLQILSFESLASIIYHPEFQSHKLQKINNVRHKNEFYRVFDFVHNIKPFRQTKGKRSILYSIQTAILKMWNHIQPQDTVSLSKENDKKLQDILLNESDHDFWRLW